MQDNFICHIVAYCTSASSSLALPSALAAAHPANIEGWAAAGAREMAAAPAGCGGMARKQPLGREGYFCPATNGGWLLGAMVLGLPLSLAGLELL